MARHTRDTAPEIKLVPDELSVVEETEEFGLRVSYQSEEERMEAAEFLVATRVQEQVRRRVARAAMDVRDSRRGALTEAIHERPPD
jgi:hypothetical protein